MRIFAQRSSGVLRDCACRRIFAPAGFWRDCACVRIFGQRSSGVLGRLCLHENLKQRGFGGTVLDENVRTEKQRGFGGTVLV